MKTNVMHWIVGVAAVLSGGAAWAEELLEEQFTARDYSAGTIYGQNPSNPQDNTGFADVAWTDGTGGTEGTDGTIGMEERYGTYEVVPDGLTYPGLSTAGGALHFQRLASSSGGRKARRTINAASSGSADGVYWFSALFHLGPNVTEVRISLKLAKGGCPPFCFGMTGTPGTAFVRVGQDNAATTAATYAADTTHLVLVKLTNNGSTDSVELWVDPKLSSPLAEESLGTPAASILDAGNIVYNDGITFGDPADMIRFEASGDGGFIDEWRIATSLSEALPPPTPAPPHSPPSSTTAAKPASPLRPLLERAALPRQN